MTYRNLQTRSGLAALAAVLALTASPLAAQETAPVAEPVVDAPDVSTTPAPDPLAPEPVTETPVSETAAAPTTETAAPAAPSAVQRSATRSRAATPQRAPRAQATEPAAPAAASPPEALAAAEPLVAPPPVLEPAPAPVADQASTSIDQEAIEDALPIAGAAGLGLLLMAGGIAMRRRRRREELDETELMPLQAEAVPADHVEEPSFVREPVPAAAVAASMPSRPIAGDVPTTKLPEGFDLSRFGPHVRAAYRGPTEDNPSLSLKYRLRRAAAMDQRARLAAEQVTAPAQPATPTYKPAPQWNANEGFMLRRAPAKPAARPAYQK